MFVSNYMFTFLFGKEELPRRPLQLPSHARTAQGRLHHQGLEEKGRGWWVLNFCDGVRYNPPFV